MEAKIYNLNAERSRRRSGKEQPMLRGRQITPQEEALMRQAGQDLIMEIINEVTDEQGGYFDIDKIMTKLRGRQT